MRWLFLLAVTMAPSGSATTLCGGAVDGARQDRARASLLGLAWGDSFGAPVEYWDPKDTRAVFGGYAELPRAYPVAKLSATVSESAIARLRPLGLYTDDGAQALALLRAAATGPGWSEAHRRRWRALIVDGFAARAWRGVGKMFVEAGGRMADPTVAHGQTGSPSAGIGAAMRVGFLGGYFPGDAAALERAVVESTLMTHADIRAAAIAFAVAEAARALVLGIPAATVAADLPAAVRAMEARWAAAGAEWTFLRGDTHQVSTALGRVLPHRNDRSALAAKVIHAAKDLSGVDGDTANGAFCLHGGVYAIATARADGAPAELLTEIIHQGGDTDTVAAMAGSLLGARHGTGWIPLDRLAERHRLEGYATFVAVGGGTLPDGDDAAFLRREAELTVWSDGYGKTLRRP